MDGEHLGLPDNSNPNSPDHEGPGDAMADFDTDRWRRAVRIRKLVRELEEDMREDWNTDSWGDIDEESGLYCRVRDALAIMEGI
jgi:hypothetical protein